MASTGVSSILTVLRAMVALVAGVLALVAPAQVLTVLVFGGGLLLVVDGALALASIDYGERGGVQFWSMLMRGVLAVAAGLSILFSPYLDDLVARSIIVSLVGAQAIIVGTIEALTALVARGDRSPWGPLGAGILYVAFGLVLVFVPFAGAALLVQVGGVILLAYAAVMLLRAWEAMRSVTA